ncbi:MAG: hotdog fold thioesterase [Saprospiraceae bacterium]|nr:hotdog fold thioesterase [Saprospiraceae bacterium]
MIWKQTMSLEGLNNTSKNTLVEHLGIEFIEIGEDYIKAKMPVDSRTIQPYGLLHGGASVVLAETLGSIASLGVIENFDQHMPVGVEINANHLRSASEGFVYGISKPVKLGKRLQVWNIEIKDEDNQLVCVSRITIAVIARR